MRFFLNGENLGVAFSNFDILDGLSPALTLQLEQQVKVMFDSMKYLPSDYSPLSLVSLPEFALLGDSQQQQRSITRADLHKELFWNIKREIGRAVQQECRDRSRMPSSA
eukprot:TRINITY_DN30184_c0_g2_i1.p1 TRINITY_DN30184_c0_g2~~TRINITY_DN30184_c0_g2_i1.p1  ORF type:complete len:109 (+),score=18.98 TRINITY_DN30184_c0_g2_i1:237-563(+)